MTAATVESGKLDIGRVIQQTFGVLGRNIATFSILGLLLSGLPTAIVAYFQVGLMRDQLTGIGAGNFNLSPDYIQGLGLGGLVALITSAILQGALIYATVQDLNGRKASVSDSLATGLRNFLPLLGVTILFALAVVAGLILLVVPAIMIACAWCVAVPSLVADRTGVFGAFTRSAELTRGNRWRIFGLFVIVWIALVVLSTIVNAITGVSNLAALGPAAAERLTSPLFLLVSVIQSTISSVIGSAAVAVLYVELRRARDGLGPQWLSEVFA